MKSRTFLSIAAGAAAIAALLFSTSAPSFARPPGPPPGGFHGGPGFHRPPPPPPAFHRPPPPPPRHHYRSRWHDWGFWGPLALGGIIIGADLYTRPDRVEVVPVPVPQTPVVVPAAPAAPAQQYAWYWCPTAGAFYPGIATCPVEWQIVMGTSATNPPTPPR